MRGLGMGPVGSPAPREKQKLQKAAAARRMQRAARAWSWRALLADVERDSSSLVQRAWRRALRRRQRAVSAVAPTAPLKAEPPSAIDELSAAEACEPCDPPETGAESPACADEPSVEAVATAVELPAVEAVATAVESSAVEAVAAVESPAVATVVPPATAPSAPVPLEPAPPGSITREKAEPWAAPAPTLPQQPRRVRPSPATTARHACASREPTTTAPKRAVRVAGSRPLAPRARKLIGSGWGAIGMVPGCEVRSPITSRAL